MPRERGKTDKDLYGEGLLGESLAPTVAGELKKKFQIPPFTVLNAREGWWQDRKRAWLALGIQSELGRGEDTRPGPTGSNDGEAIDLRGGLTHRTTMDGYRAKEAKGYNKAAPGGSAMPAMNYKNRERGTGTGTGTAIAGTAAKAQEPPKSTQPPKKRFAAPTITVNKPAGVTTRAPAIAVRVEESEPDYGTERPTFDDATWDEPTATFAGMDVETFPNFFLVNFKRFHNGKKISFELSDRSALDKERLRSIMHRDCIVTFNGNGYDVPMIYLALSGLTNSQLKAASDRILRGLKWWEIERELNIRIPKGINHIDLFEPNPSIRQSLKTLNGRLHGRKMMDLPYDPESWLSPAQMNVATHYCFNDIDATQLLFDAMKEPLAFRRVLSKKYDLDLRSKSDAQIGEAVIKQQVEKALGRNIKRVEVERSFSYDIPDFLKFKTDQLNGILDDLRQTTFYVNGANKIDMPEALEGRKVAFSQITCTMGIGGLHSTESNRAVVTDGTFSLIDVDVSSQYPAILMKLGLYPKALGPVFLKVYGGLLAERLAAKAAKDKVESETGKILLNGLGGKLNSAYSVMYAPRMFIAMTLTGQLSVMMFIERAEAIGVIAVSSNTDGVVLKCPRGKEEALASIIREWETATGFAVEQARYKALYNSSVNAYIAIKEGGGAKRKGTIANPWAEKDLRGQLSKNPQMVVCSDAVLAFILYGTPFEDTIRACTNIRDFVTVTNVKGGSLWRGKYLAKVVRYYWAKGGEPILRAKATASGTHGKVPKSDGCRPLMELPDTLPTDIDYERYIQEAKELAIDLAVIEKEGLFK